MSVVPSIFFSFSQYARLISVCRQSDPEFGPVFSLFVVVTMAILSTHPFNSLDIYQVVGIIGIYS